MCWGIFSNHIFLVVNSITILSDIQDTSFKKQCFYKDKPFYNQNAEITQDSERFSPL